MSKYSMRKYLFLCNTSGTKPVLIFKGFRLDAHTEPMIPEMQNNNYEVARTSRGRAAAYQSSHWSHPIIGEPSSCLPQAGQIQTLLPASSV